MGAGSEDVGFIGIEAAEGFDFRDFRCHILLCNRSQGVDGQAHHCFFHVHTKGGGWIQQGSVHPCQPFPLLFFQIHAEIGAHLIRQHLGQFSLHNVTGGKFLGPFSYDGELSHVVGNLSATKAQALIFRNVFIDEIFRKSFLCQGGDVVG